MGEDTNDMHSHWIRVQNAYTKRKKKRYILCTSCYDFDFMDVIDNY